MSSQLPITPRALWGITTSKSTAGWLASWRTDSHAQIETQHTFLFVYKARNPEPGYAWTTTDANKLFELWPSNITKELSRNNIYVIARKNTNEYLTLCKSSKNRGHTNMRVDDTSNSHTRLTVNSRTLSLTLERSYQLWTNFREPEA